jgi:HD-GYP domain-containing protein (c-di-GMP phosphodiesterase class II)
MYIELDVGWLAHPFPKGSFKISSERQIETIRGLGLKRVRYVIEKSDPLEASFVEASTANLLDVAQTPPAAAAHAAEQEAATHRLRRTQQLRQQQQTLVACERQFGEAIRHYKKALEQIPTQPKAAAEHCLSMVSGFVGEMLAEGESAIRLLSEGMGDRASMHPVNVTIISLLLGKAMGLTRNDMMDLGMAAFLHDVGKTQLPDRVRWLEENFSTSEYKTYQEHVAQGVMLGKRMNLTNGALLAIAQHHEMVDGSGFPSRLKGESLTMVSKILALVNRYENLCNPGRPALAITPHEALSLIFAQLKTRFDGVALSAFIRMMGVYPPGSVVQLVDERFALVVSVNSTRPLKPRVIVHEPAIPKHEALILDLEHSPMIGIRRSLKPVSLPKEALDYLSPRMRICYFFERAMEPELAKDTP